MNTEKIKIENKLYKTLLKANIADKSERTLSDIFELIIKVSNAQFGYFELKNINKKLLWSKCYFYDKDFTIVQDRESRNIISEAIKNEVSKTVFSKSRYSDVNNIKSGINKNIIWFSINEKGYVLILYLQLKEDDNYFENIDIEETEMLGRNILSLMKESDLFLSEPGESIKENYNFKDFIGNSKAFNNIIKEVITISQIDITTLITGKSGTGKTHLAKIIHKNSLRKDGPFIHVNCANLPEQLIESELFGAVKGAHSTALHDIQGKISAASGGTLFLDEIGELPLNVQAKFLQFIEEGYYFPLGAKKYEKSNVRIIVASNIEFKEAIKNKKFREDLYYRISVFPVKIPSLKERKSDIADLLKHFISKYADKYNLPVYNFDDAVKSKLYAYEWPGNIRELENVIIRAMLKAKCCSDKILCPDHFIIEAEAEITLNECLEDVSYKESKNSWEREFIAANLTKNLWNVSKTAEQLGLSRAHMNNLIKMHELERTI